jgi:phenylacetate-CoA ligase
VKYAYENVDFYHKLLRENRLKPDDIRDRSDLNRLPIIRKSMIRDDPSAFLSKQFDPSKLRCLSTSGSTGKPMFIYISPIEDIIRKVRHLRANTSCGQKIRDRWVIITSPKHFGTSTRLQRIFGFYVPIPVLVFSSVEEQISTIELLNPDVLDGYSSSLLLLAKGVEAKGIDTIHPKFIIGGAELIDDTSKRFIEDVFAVPFYDQYACVEFDRISWQCPEKVGYHIDSDSLILQFMDDEGTEVAKGEKGEIVCTSLFNYAMPLIRYEIGDIGTESVETCSCGRKLPLMKVIEGRSDSVIQLSDGRLISPRAFTVTMSMFKYYERIDQYRIIQKKIDAFELEVKLIDNSLDRPLLKKELAMFIRKTLCLDESTIISVNLTDRLDIKQTGKFGIVISELKKYSSQD